ncbi:MAG: hypothetical protein LBM23_02900 [Propionibacteriaceae bacterium]|jgi:hypothetical protein|nr:hypothetical protein [Propionibacteriaceae bacterium]
MAESRRSSTGLALVAILVGVAVLIAFAYSVVRWYRDQTDYVDSSSGPGCLATVDGEEATLTLEQSPNAAIIAGTSVGRWLAPRAASIGLTTAFQESGIRNIDYGDRDSVGLFQQRPSQGWGTVEEIMDPHYATNAFYNVMVTIPGWESADLGDIAQEVQRSGFPDAYDKHVSTARLLASALVGQTPAALSCVTDETPEPDPQTLINQIGWTYSSRAVLTDTVLPDEASGSTATILRYETDAEATAWSVAAFAQSWVCLGVTKVEVGGAVWSHASGSYAPWDLGDGTSEVPATTIAITVGA